MFTKLISQGFVMILAEDQTVVWRRKVEHMSPFWDEIVNRILKA